MYSLPQRLFNSVIAILLLCTFLLSPADAQKKKTPYEPTENYTVQEIEGWTVYVNRRLAKPESDIGQKALKLMRNQLQQIAMLLPDQRVKELQTIKIWLDDDPENQIHYHPNVGWLKSNGFNPARVKCVDVGRADRFYAVRRTQPFVMLHELSHAYHDQFLGFDDQRIQDAYKAAKKGGKYEKVLRIQEQYDRHYALTNHKEYFAECSEAFLGTNDFFPFVRAELKEHDRKMFDVLREIWLSKDPRESKVKGNR